MHLEKSGYFRKDAIKVIYNGVDSNYFNPRNDCRYLYDEWKIPHNAKIIGMVGRVNSWKGQEDFLEAANIIMAKDESVYTIFVGGCFEGEEWRIDNLKQLINQSPYKDRIIMGGYRTDTRFIYKLYDVFVLPSINPDPLPTVVLEAMSTGKPIVGYRHGGICEMVKDGYNGFLAKIRDVKDLSEKISILLKDDDLRKKMGENSRNRLLENFSIKKYINSYSNEYDKLLKENSKGDKR